MPYIIWLVILFLSNAKLQQLNRRISELTVKSKIYQEARHQLYNYQSIELKDLQNKQQFIPVINHSFKENFLEELKQICKVKSGQKTFLFFLRQQFYWAESYQHDSIVYNQNCQQINRIADKNIQYFSLLKATNQNSINFLTSQMEILMFTHDFNQTRQFVLKTKLTINEVKGFYISKIEGKIGIALFSVTGKIFIYDEEGKEKAVLNTQNSPVIKLIDHIPNPIIVGTNETTFFQFTKMSQIEMGCPHLENPIIDVGTQSSFSTHFYVLTRQEILLFAHSFKKNERQCKISQRIRLQGPQMSQITIFYPLILLNNTYFNISDGSSRPYLIPLKLCFHNEYQSSYKNNQNYLLHRCCDAQAQCQNRVYLKQKKQSSSSRYYKFGIFLVLLIIILIKIFSKQEKKQIQEFKPRLQGEARLKQLINEFENNPAIKSNRTKKNR